jgi:hypothetical protein
MPPGRPSNSRHLIGRSLTSVGQAWGFRMLSLRETAWFYSVGLITAVALLWSPSQATTTGPALPPVAVSGDGGAPYAVTGEPRDRVGLFAEGGRALDAKPLVRMGRGSLPPSRVDRRNLPQRRPAWLAAASDLRSQPTGARGITPRSPGYRGIRMSPGRTKGFAYRRSGGELDSGDQDDDSLRRR